MSINSNTISPMHARKIGVSVKRGRLCGAFARNGVGGTTGGAAGCAGGTGDSGTGVILFDCVKVGRWVSAASVIDRSGKFPDGVNRVVCNDEGTDICGCVRMLG